MAVLWVGEKRTQELLECKIFRWEKRQRKGKKGGGKLVHEKLTHSGEIVLVGCAFEVFLATEIVGREVDDVLPITDLPWTFSKIYT